MEKNSPSHESYHGGPAGTVKQQAVGAPVVSPSPARPHLQPSGVQLQGDAGSCSPAPALGWPPQGRRWGWEGCDLRPSHPDFSSEGHGLVATAVQVPRAVPRKQAEKGGEVGALTW